jgi:ferrous iron transport protein A
LEYDPERESAQVLALNLLPVGRAAVIHELELPEAVEHHLMHMGFSPEARVVAVRRAPAGDPTVYAIDGMEIALRRETACGILVEPVEQVFAEPAGVNSSSKTKLQTASDLHDGREGQVTRHGQDLRGLTA